jgi:hypothetical protein
VSHLKEEFWPAQRRSLDAFSSETVAVAAGALWAREMSPRETSVDRRHLRMAAVLRRGYATMMVFPNDVFTVDRAAAALSRLTEDIYAGSFYLNCYRGALMRSNFLAAGLCSARAVVGNDHLESIFHD